MKLKSYGLSDIGVSRTNNEDVFASIPEMGFFVLADGMGGHQGGEVAAKEAVEHLCSSMKKLHTKDPLEIIIYLRYAIERANQRVFKLGKKNKELSGMGTTLCCLMWTETVIVYAHVGDSRIYRLRDNELELLTEDHSLLAKWEKTGKTSATPYPYKNVITKAIGTTNKANPEIAISTSEPGDLFFLCTDGLSDVLEKKDIKKIILDSKNIENASQSLIQTAKIKGSSDNITVLMIQKEEYEEDLSRQQRDDSNRFESAQIDAR